MMPKLGASWSKGKTIIPADIWRNSFNTNPFPKVACDAFFPCPFPVLLLPLLSPSRYQGHPVVAGAGTIVVI